LTLFHQREKENSKKNRPRVKRKKKVDGQENLLKGKWGGGL